MIGELIGIGATVGALGGGYVWTKNFVRSRLRFVDAVHARPVPWIVGGVVALVAAPIAGIIHLGIAGVALGVGAGLGVKSGQNDRHLLGP